MVYALTYRRFGNTRYKPLDGDMMDARVLDPETAHPVTRHRGRAVNSGYPLDPATVPKRFRWGGNTTQVPDMIAWGGAYIISERFRDLIESFEPDIHQFLPIDLQRPNGSHAARHYLMQACNQIDSVNAEHTTFVFSNIWIHEGLGGREMVFSKQKIGSAHLWNGNLTAIDLLCSNELGDNIINIGLTGVKLYFHRKV